MAVSVTWSRLSGAPGGQSEIVPTADFDEILSQMHPRSSWFNCRRCAHARFVAGTHAGSTCIVRLRISFNCN